VNEQTKPPARTRTVSWNDPAISSGQIRKLSGLDFLRKIRDGEIPNPPIAELLGFRLAKVEPGAAAFEFDPGEHHYNPAGGVHGGVAATLLDSAMTCAVQTTLPAGTGCTTLEFKVSLVRPITVDTGHLIAEAKLIHGGSRIATAEGKLVDGAGKVYAHATTTCIILS
jgi:uncharacterized protein (TIGR00369 family)